MKRVPIPPTKYDPMRPVQAKMAAPVGGPGVAIPPTRFGSPPIQLKAILKPALRQVGVLQRAAAANPQTGDAYVASMTTAQCQGYLLANCVIGSDWEKKSDIVKELQKGSPVNCLAVWLKANNGVNYTGPRNYDWMIESINARKTFRVLGDSVLDAEYYVKHRNKRYIVVRPKNDADKLKTRDEICLLLAKGYRWHAGAKTFFPPRVQPNAEHFNNY